MAQSLSFCPACDISNPVNWKCLDCDFCICDSCKVVHQRIPATKDHTVMKIKDLDSTSVRQHSRKIFEKCKTHKMDITLYCSACHVFVCSDCIAETHRKHELDKIEHVLQNKQKEVDEILEEAEGRRTSFLSQKLQVAEVVEGFKTNTNELRGTLKQHEMTLKRKVEKHFQECISEVVAKEEFVISEANKCEQQIDSAISEVDDVISTLKMFNEKPETSSFLAAETREVRKKLTPLKLSISLPKLKYTEARVEYFGKIQSEDYVVEVLPPIEKLSGSAEEENLLTRKQIPNTSEKYSKTNISDICCPLCVQPMKDRRTFHYCGHSFCSQCIKTSFFEKRECMICGEKYMLKNGSHRKVEMEETCSNEFNALIFSSTRGVFIGNLKIATAPIFFVSILPSTGHGEMVHKMLKEAFKRRLLFENTEKGIVEKKVLGDLMSISNERYQIEHQLKTRLPLTQDKMDQVIEYLESQGVTEADV